MPNLSISGCGVCPFVKFHNSDGYDAKCRIQCNHEDSMCDDVLTVKIRSVDMNVYFNCPLESPKQWKYFPGQNCPKCGGDPEVFTKSKVDGIVNDEEDVRCSDCNNTGIISVEDSESADVIWDDED